MLNSTIVAGGTVIVSMTVGIFGAYAFAMLRFRFRRITLMVFLVTYMLPPIALLVPLYLIMSSLGLLDSKLGLIIIYTSYVTPFVLWILSQLLPHDPGGARAGGAGRRLLAHGRAVPGHVAGGSARASSRRSCSRSCCRGTSSSTP